MLGEIIYCVSDKRYELGLLKRCLVQTNREMKMRMKIK